MHETDKQAALRLRQGAAAADRLGRPVPGRFVTGPELAAARQYGHEFGVAVAAEGGHPDADRLQICFSPAGEAPLFTLVWVEIRWDARFARLGHSDLLGSLMSLGLERSCFGDLIAAEDTAWLASLPEAAERLPLEWTEAGHTRLRCRILTEAPSLPVPQGKRVLGTVASLRLDALLSAGMNESRTAAAELIRAGRVEVDHAPELRTDRLIAPGQLLSVRGYGRIRLCEAGAPNRKGRIPVVLECFTRAR